MFIIGCCRRRGVEDDPIIQRYLAMRGITRHEFDLEQLLVTEPSCSDPEETLFWRKLALVQHGRDAHAWLRLMDVFLPAQDAYTNTMQYLVQNSKPFQITCEDLDGLWRYNIAHVSGLAPPYIPQRRDVRNDADHFRLYPEKLPSW